MAAIKANAGLFDVMSPGMITSHRCDAAQASVDVTSAWNNERTLMSPGTMISHLLKSVQFSEGTC